MKKLFFVLFATLAIVSVKPTTTHAAGCVINAVLLPDPSGPTNYRYSSDINSGVSTVATTAQGSYQDQDLVLDYNSNGSCGSSLDVYESGPLWGYNGSGVSNSSTYIGSVPAHSDPNNTLNLFDPNSGAGGPGFGPNTTRTNFHLTNGNSLIFSEGWVPAGRYENFVTVYLTQHGTTPPTNYLPSSGGAYGGAGPVVAVQAMALPASTVYVNNSCSAGGTWTISPFSQDTNNPYITQSSGSGTASAGPLTVLDDPKSGTTYTVSFNPPANYIGTVDAPASATLYGGDYASFTTECSPQPILCPDRSQAPDNNYAECPCSPPDPATQTLDCSTAHGAGYTGEITQERTSTPPFPDCPASAWVTTADTCVPLCTAPLTETQTVSCGAGYTGSITQQQTKSGPTDNPACTFPGTWTTTSNTCVPVVTSTINVNSNLASAWSIYDGLGTLVAQASSPETSGSYVVTPGSGTAYTISPNSLSGYTLDTSNNVTGSGATFSLFGNDAGTFNLLYTAIPPSFAYTLSNAGEANVEQGNPVQEVITKTLTAGSPQAVGLSVQNLPQGITSGGFSAQDCTLTCASTLSLQVAASVAPGSYPITVDGTPNGESTQFNLDVTPTPDVNVTCAASPSVSKVGQAVTWTATATGGSGTYSSYSWSGSDIPTAPNVPTSTSDSYAITYSTVGSKSAAATVTDSNGKSGTCTAGTAVVSVNPTFQEF